MIQGRNKLLGYVKKRFLDLLIPTFHRDYKFHLCRNTHYLTLQKENEKWPCTDDWALQ